MLPFLRRNRQTLGLDLGTGFVKAAVVNHAGPEPVLVQARHQPLPPDAIVEGELMDPPVVVDTIRSLVDSLDLPKAKVVAAVGGRDVIVKKIQMDRMAAEDAREVIHWEAEQYVPFEMENVQLDFQILDPDADGLRMNVLLVAAKRELVEQKVRLLQDAGLEVPVVDVDAFALYNAFELNYPDSLQGVVSLVDVGNEVSTILVMQDGVPVVTRDIPLGSRHMREDLQRMHGLPFEEAEALTYGRSDRTREFAPLLAGRSEELAMSIERAVSFLTVDSPSGQGLGAVYLCGGGARLPHLAEVVADRLRVRTEVVNPLERLSIHPDALTHFPAEEVAPMLMLPVGLALRNVP